MTDEVKDFPSKEKEVPKVLLPVEYALGWLSSSISSNFTLNTPATWNNFESNNESIKRGSSGNYTQIKLQPGKVYRLSASICVGESGSSDVYRRIRWYNVTKSQWIGCEGGGFDNSSYQSIGSGLAIAYIQVDEESILELRCSQASGDVDLLIRGYSFEVQHLQNLSI